MTDQLDSEKFPAERLNNLLIKAAFHGRLDLVAGLLEQGGVNVNARDPATETALHYAANNGHAEVVKALLAHGADVNITDDDGNTPLHFAANKARADVVRVLLSEPGVMINAGNAGGLSPLSLACRSGSLDIVNQLLDRKEVDVNNLAKYGSTALIQAAGSGHVDIVKRMLECEGITVEATYTGFMYSPLTLAQAKGYREIENVLREFMDRQNKPSKPRPAAGHAPNL